MTKVVIFTGPDCAYCKRAKALLDDLAVEYVERDVSPGSVYLDEFRQRLPRAKSIPQIFIDGQHIGGFEDLEIWHRDGRLK